MKQIITLVIGLAFVGGNILSVFQVPAAIASHSRDYGTVDGKRVPFSSGDWRNLCASRPDGKPSPYENDCKERTKWLAHSGNTDPNTPPEPATPRNPTGGVDKCDIGRIAAGMRKIKSTDDAKQAFFGKTDFDPKSATVEVGDPQKDFRPHSETAGEIKNLKGNPWFELGLNGGVNSPSPNYTIDGYRFNVQDCVEVPAFAFVLGGIEKGKGYVNYIFKNEYNPAVALAFRAEDGEAPDLGGAAGDAAGGAAAGFAAPSGFTPLSKLGGTIVGAGLGGASNITAAIDGTDKYRLVYSPSCGAAFTNKSYVAEVENGPKLGDEGNFGGQALSHQADDVKKVQKKFGLPNSSVCQAIDGNMGLFEKMIRFALAAVADMLQGLIDLLLGWLTSAMTVNPLDRGVLNVWKVFRDLVNLVFVLVLITVAFSNILRIDTERYGARALLPRLVFAVIAVNFSLMMVQILTNVATILSQPFLSKATDFALNPPTNFSVGDSPSLGLALGGLIMMIAILVAIAVLLFFFIIRTLMIWILAALSPFVFLFMVLPFTRSLSRSWVTNTLKWVFMAPIAIAILYIGSGFISASGEDPKLESFDFINDLILFVGLAFAAVMIPLKLGGEVMGHAANVGKAGGKLGGRFGGTALAGTVGKIPTGGGKDLATRTRATAYGLGLRKAKSHPPGSRAGNRQEAALEHLQEQTAENKGIGRLTGATEGQQTRARQRLLHTAQQEQAQVAPMGKHRIAWGNAAQRGEHGAAIAKGGETDAYGKIASKGDILGQDAEGKSVNYGQFLAGEEDFANSRIGSEAAFAELAAGNQVSPDLNKAYAKSGLAQQNMHNPALASLDRNGDYQPLVAKSRAANMSQNDLKGQQHEFWEHANKALVKESKGTANEYDKAVLSSARAFDTQKLAYAMTTGTRNSFDHAATKDNVKAFAASGGFKDAKKNVVVNESYNKDQKGAEDVMRRVKIIPPKIP